MRAAQIPEEIRNSRNYKDIKRESIIAVVVRYRE